MNTSVNSEQFLNKKDNLRKPQKCVCTDETDGVLTLFLARCKTHKLLFLQDAKHTKTKAVYGSQKKCYNGMLRLYCWMLVKHGESADKHLTIAENTKIICSCRYVHS